MLVFVAAICLVLVLLFQKWRRWCVQEWVRQQLEIANFHYAGEPNCQERLRLRATENHRLKAAFGINNSLTTDDVGTHKDFLGKASQLVNKSSRNWETLYSSAEAFLEMQLRDALMTGRDSLPLADSVRCMVLAVVLSDSFGLDPARISMGDLSIITQEINSQWLQSKCHPDDVAPSQLLNSTIAKLDIKSPSFTTPNPRDPTPTEVLSLLMPQYETLWRVVLLTFVTAYHHQPAAYPDTLQRTADVPSCLGTATRAEEEALKLANEGLRLYPSNKHLYRAPATAATTTTSSSSSPPIKPAAADISTLHRHPSIWGRDALAFCPARFDEDRLAALQREAYIPFSVAPHKCPAWKGFGERMVTVLVVALGRGLGPGKGRVDFGGGKGKGKGGELPTGRDEMEGWVWEVARGVGE